MIIHRTKYTHACQYVNLSIYMCVCVCIYIYIYFCMYMFVCMYVYICAYKTKSLITYLVPTHAYFYV